MAAPGESIRRQLREAVRPIWSSDAGWNLREELKDVARKTIEEAYELCARGKFDEVARKLGLSKTPSNVQECYRLVAEKVDLERQYEDKWGTSPK